MENQQIPQQPPVAQMMPTEKPPLFSIVSVLIVIIAIGGYIALASYYDFWPFEKETIVEVSPTPRPTATLVSNETEYENTEFRFRIDYPVEWPAPVRQLEEEFSGAYRLGGQEPVAKFNLGNKVEGLCEGEACYQYFVEIYNIQGWDEIKGEMDSNQVIKIIDRSAMAGRIIYEEGGIGRSKVGLFWGPEYIYVLRVRNVDLGAPAEKIFDRMFPTIKIF